MHSVRRQYEAGGMAGTARSAMLREMDRLAEIEGDDAAATAAALAAQVRPGIDAGLHPWTYVPEAWLIVAGACERAGDGDNGRACRAAGRRWIERALPHVGAEFRAAFVEPQCSEPGAAG